MQQGKVISPYDQEKIISILKSGATTIETARQTGFNRHTITKYRDEYIKRMEAQKKREAQERERALKEETRKRLVAKAEYERRVKAAESDRENSIWTKGRFSDEDQIKMGVHWDDSMGRYTRLNNERYLLTDIYMFNYVVNLLKEQERRNGRAVEAPIKAAIETLRSKLEARKASYQK